MEKTIAKTISYIVINQRCTCPCGLIKAVFHYVEFCARSDIFRASENVKLLSTLLLHNFGEK